MDGPKSTARTRNAETNATRRTTFNQELKRLVLPAGGGPVEQVLMSSREPYSNADVYVRASATVLLAFSGAVFRAYALTGEVRSLEYQSAPLALPDALEGLHVLRMRNHGALDGWEITVSLDPATVAIPPGDVAVSLVSWDCGGGDTTESPSPPGPVLAFAQYVRATLTNTDIVTALGTSLWQIWATLDPGSGSDVWFQVFDQAGALVGGETPVLRLRITAGAIGSFDFSGVEGYTFQNGIVWGLSSTANTYTSVAADPTVIADVGAIFG
jgi:hypothetical protein